MTPAAAANLPTPRTRKALLFTLALTAVFLALGMVYPGWTNPRLAGTFYVITALLLCWQRVLFFRAWAASRGFALEYVPVRSHYVQACLQIAIFI